VIPKPLNTTHFYAVSSRNLNDAGMISIKLHIQDFCINKCKSRKFRYTPFNIQGVSEKGGHILDKCSVDQNTEKTPYKHVSYEALLPRTRISDEKSRVMCERTRRTFRAPVMECLHVWRPTSHVSVKSALCF
jgi:hypothetical protein